MVIEAKSAGETKDIPYRCPGCGAQWVLAQAVRPVGEGESLPRSFLCPDCRDGNR